MMTKESLATSTESLTELEIDAFMGPQIKRARIALVVIGVLYAVIGYLMYREIAAGLAYTREWGGDEQAYVGARNIVIALFAASVAQIALAAVAGKRAMFAFYAATGVFAVLFALLVWGTGTLILVQPPWSVFWWLSAICVGLGFVAARKAEQLRRERAPARALAR